MFSGRFGIPVVRRLSDRVSSSVETPMRRFQRLEKEEIEGKRDDVYSPNYVPKKYLRHSAEYGTPKPGTLTAARAKKAAQHIGKEMIQICEIIAEYGSQSAENGKTQITFGDLFGIYQFISDKVVGILLRARKHEMVTFDGEMLFQRRDEHKIITLLADEAQLNKFRENYSKKT